MEYAPELGPMLHSVDLFDVLCSCYMNCGHCYCYLTCCLYDVLTISEGEVHQPLVLILWLLQALQNMTMQNSLQYEL